MHPFTRPFVYLEEGLSGETALVDLSLNQSVPEALEAMPGFAELKKKGFRVRVVFTEGGAVVTDLWDSEGRWIYPDRRNLMVRDFGVPLSRALSVYRRDELSSAMPRLKQLAKDYPNGLILKDGKAMVEITFEESQAEAPIENESINEEAVQVLVEEVKEAVAFLDDALLGDMDPVAEATFERTESLVENQSEAAPAEKPKKKRKKKS